jgi:hypothetical protein
MRPATEWELPMTRRCILAYLNAVEPFSAAAPSEEMLRGRAAVELIAESATPALSILDCANALAFIRAVEPNDLARFHSPSVEPSPAPAT